jgi:peptide/nickel transport system substrate-binding protein
VTTVSSGGSTTVAGGVTTASSAAADRNASFRFAFTVGFTTLDPTKSTSGGDILYLSPVYDRLVAVQYTDKGPQLIPKLATSWKVADDASSVTFELRSDVKFQDGTPFDAAAVKANIERAKAAGSAIVGQVAGIDTVEAVDATHVVFHLSKPDPGVLWTLAALQAGFMVSPGAFSSDLSTKTDGSGPFVLVSAQKDGDVVYKRSDSYWVKDEPSVANLTISTVTDANARLNGLRSGDYDAAYLMQPQSAQAKSLESEGYHYELRNSPVLWGVLLNAKMAPFDDVRVREAVSLAINRSELSKTVLQGTDEPAYQSFAKGFPGYDPSLAKDPYDPAKAKELIKEAGAEGAKVTLAAFAVQPQQSVAEVVQQALTDIGLTVDVAPMNASNVRAAWAKGGEQALVGPIPGYVDSSQTLVDSYLSNQNPAPPPPDLIDMANKAKALPLGSPEREQAYQGISRYLVENPVHVPLATLAMVVVTRPNVLSPESVGYQTIDVVDFGRVGKTKG